MTNSTIVHWGPEPTNRGTVSVVWSCLSVLLICTWTVQHPDLHGGSFSRRHKILSKTVVFFGTLLFPEFYLTLAIMQWRLVRLSYQEFSEDQQQISETTTDIKAWSIDHFWLAAMGGLNIREPNRIEELNASAATGEQEQYSLTELNMSSLGFLIKGRHILLEDLPIATVRDKSKSDAIGKLYAIVQSTWLVIQCIGRAAAQLPTTQIEIATIAYVTLMAATYYFLWDKPKDPDTPVVLDLRHNLNIDRHLSSFEDHDLYGSDVTYVMLVIPIMGTVFGAIHCIVWNSFFSTVVEMWLWRVCSLVITVLPGILFVWLFYEPISKMGNGEIERRKFPWIYNSTAVASIALWVIICTFWLLSRVYLLVAMFTSLRAQEADVYRAIQWANLIHFL